MNTLADKPGRVLTPALINALDQDLALVQYASDILKAAGFVLFTSSLKSESCYYKLPDKEALIRVAAHGYSRTENRSLGIPVIANITFTNGFTASIEAARNVINAAVGKYFLYPLTVGDNPDMPYPQGIPLVKNKRKNRYAPEKIIKLKGK